MKVYLFSLFAVLSIGSSAWCEPGSIECIGTAKDGKALDIKVLFLPHGGQAQLVGYPRPDLNVTFSCRPSFVVGPVLGTCTEANPEAGVDPLSFDLEKGEENGKHVLNANLARRPAYTPGQPQPQHIVLVGVARCR